MDRWQHACYLMPCEQAKTAWSVNCNTIESCCLMVNTGLLSLVLVFYRGSLSCFESGLQHTLFNLDVLVRCSRVHMPLYRPAALVSGTGQRHWSTTNKLVLYFQILSLGRPQKLRLTLKAFYTPPCSTTGAWEVRGKHMLIK